MENNDSGLFRPKKVYFSQVSNIVLRDKNLSLKAKGLFGLIQSYITIEGFTLYKNTLKKDCSEGEKAFESAWKELKDSGYLIQYKLQKPDGSFYYEYELLDDPEETLENGQSIQTPKKEGVDKGGGGKGGVFNNTDINNTYSINLPQPSAEGADRIELSEIKHSFVTEYDKLRRSYGFNEKRISVDNAAKALDIINELEERGVTLHNWMLASVNYLNTQNPGHDGDIVHFLSSHRRHFKRFYE